MRELEQIEVLKISNFANLIFHPLWEKGEKCGEKWSKMENSFSAHLSIAKRTPHINFSQIYFLSSINYRGMDHIYMATSDFYGSDEIEY